MNYLNILSKKVAVISMISVFFLACSKNKEFNKSPDGNDSEGVTRTPFSMKSEFPFQAPTDFFVQENFEKNEISIHFQVTDPTGAVVQDLRPQDILLAENQNSILNFELSNLSQASKAEIIFVLDVTTGMQQSITTLLTEVDRMAAVLKDKNIQPTFCVVTFLDRTKKKCTQFVLDHPQTEENENLVAFRTEISKLRTSSGGDREENPLRALIDAANSPWTPGAQRVAILITDEAFHHSPRNQGNAGSQAPKYEDTIRSLMASQMSVYVVAPQKPGYSTSFDGFPSLAAASSGRHFNYSQFVSGTVSLTQVMTEISEKLTFFHKVQFKSEENPGSDPTLPMSGRGYALQIRDRSDFRVQLGTRSSTWPEGRPSYKMRWPLSREYREDGDFLVWVNEILVQTGVRIEDDHLVFSEAPAPAAQIEVSYQPKRFQDHLALSPVIYPEALSLETLRVSMNGILIPVEELKLSRDTEGRFVFNPEILVFGFTDRYQIFDHQGLKIESFGETLQGSENGP